MLQIQRLNIEGAMYGSAILDPGTSDIENLKKILQINIWTHHKAVASKCTINHLDGLKAMLSALSMPFNQVRYSGQMKALPA